MSHLMASIFFHHWFFHPLGSCTGYNCKGYQFWSGIAGSFLTSLPGWVIAALLFIRHANCHTPWCMRVGKYDVPGTPYRLCKKHHPNVPNKLTQEDIVAAANGDSSNGRTGDFESSNPGSTPGSPSEVGHRT